MRKITAMMAAAVVAAGLGFTAPAVASAATAQARTAASQGLGDETNSITWGTCAEKALAQAAPSAGTCRCR